MLRKSKNLAIRARLEGSAPEVQVYWRHDERVTQFRFFVSRSPESIVSARAETRARATVGQSVGPLLRIGSTSAPRGASVVGHLSSGSEGTSRSPSASRKPGLSRASGAFVAWRLGVERFFGLHLPDCSCCPDARQRKSRVRARDRVCARRTVTFDSGLREAKKRN